MSNQITLYKHQKKLVDTITKRFKKGNKKVLAQSPTGSGKTIMFSYISEQAAKKNKKVLIITNRVELLTQAGGTIEKFDIDPYYVKAGTKFIDRSKSIYIGMSQTLRRRLDMPLWFDFVKNKIDLIIIDEAHIQEFNHFFEKEGLLEDKFVIGFTATPSRNGKMTQLGLQYDYLVNGESIKKLIKKGYLVNCDIYDCGSPDLSNVTINKSKGDYSEISMFKQFDSPKLYKGLVKNYKRLTPNEKMIVFCCNVEHAINTCKQLNKSGIEAKFVASKKAQPKEPRKWTKASKAIFDEKFNSYKLYEKNVIKYSGSRGEVFKWFKSSSNGVLVNVDIATTGFDDPTIKVVALYRATQSLTLYLQMLGRGARISKDTGKTHFTVLDFGGNKSRFGGYDVDRGWSLWHDEVKSDGGVPPMKVCGIDAKSNKIEGVSTVKKGCERLILASYKICPFCGFKYPERNPAKEAELLLAEIVDEKGVSLKVKSFKEMSFEELTKYREIKRHSINWLYRLLWVREKEKTILAYAKEYNWKKYRIKKVLEICKGFD